MDPSQLSREASAGKPSFPPKPPLPPSVPPKPPVSSEVAVPINAAKAIPVPPKPAAPVPAPIVIRTMQDDLADLKKAVVAAPKVIPAPVPVRSVLPPVPIRPITRTSITATAVSAPAAVPQRFPLPPKPQKTVTTPPPRPQRHWGRRLLVVFLVLIFLGGTGLGGWYAWNKWGGVTQLITKTPVVVPANEVLPAQTQLLIGYHLASPADRAAIKAAWQTSSGQLMAGNPSTLLADDAIQELYYVVLPDETRPYLVAPKTAASQQVFSQLDPDQVLEQDGWYIAHTLAVAAYQAALEQGKRTTTLPAGEPIVLEMVSPALQQLRQSLAGKNFAAGQLQGLNLNGKFNSDATALTFTGSSSWRTTLPEGNTDLRLLVMIPGDATVVRLGSNFQEDIGRWQEVAKVISSQLLDPPAVSSLVKQLATPYAYYHRLGPDGSLDVGLVIELPAILRGQLVLGDSALEEGLQALTGLLQIPNIPVEFPQIAFTDTTYNDLPLRYVNLVGPTQTLDYAISGNHLLISTSKEGMRTLIDTTKGAGASFSPPAAWVIPAGREVILGSISQSALLELLPHDAKLTTLPFGLAISPREAAVAVEGIVQLAP